MCFVNQDNTNCSLNENDSFGIQRKKFRDSQLRRKFQKLDCNKSLYSDNSDNSEIQNQTFDLNQYVFNKCQKHFLNPDQVINDYKVMTANYLTCDHEKLLSKVDNLFNNSFSLTKRNLMKIICKSNRIFSKIPNLNPNTVCEFNMTHQNESWKVGTYRDRQGDLVIFKFEGTQTAKENPNFLGEGNYGIVQKICDISNAQFVALKTSKTNERRKIKSIRIEVNLLKRFTNSGLGLQRGLSEVLTFDNGILGCTTRFYNKGSLFNGIEELHESITEKELLQLIIDLFSGLKNLHSNGIIHGDMKPANCLLNIVTIDNRLNYEVVIGDLGGAISKEQLLNSNSYMGTINTDECFTMTDVERLIETHQNNKNEWLKFCEKRDLFATARTVWFMVTKGKPYLPKKYLLADGKTKTVADTDVLYNIDLVKRKIGESAANILIQALRENPSARPSIDEIISTMKHEIDLQESINDLLSFEEFENIDEGTCELSGSN